MSMLILGLVLVRNIFTGSISSVDDLNDKVKSEITNLFAEENAKVAIRLGSDRTAKIKANGEPFRIAFGAQSPDGGAITKNSDLKYRIELQSKQEGPGNCVDKLGVSGATKLFQGVAFDGTGKTGDISFDEFSGANAFTRISLSIPEGTLLCTQKVFITVYDRRSGSSSTSAFGGTSFIFDVEEKGIFS